MDPGTLLPVWDAKGHITVKRGNTTVAMPTGPEQLRMRLTVMANTLIMMRMKHTARTELEDITPAFFEKYRDYLLGDYVYGLRASDDYGGMIPPWTLVLSYEHAIRKHCYKTMAQQSLPFKLALENSWKDATVKERHFTTPLGKLKYQCTAPWAIFFFFSGRGLGRLSCSPVSRPATARLFASSRHPSSAALSRPLGKTL